MSESEKTDVRKAEDAVRLALSWIDAAWGAAGGRQRVYLTAAGNLLERAGGKLAKADRGLQARFNREAQP